LAAFFAATNERQLLLITTLPREKSHGGSTIFSSSHIG
jgi:hypothetical protein